MRYAVTGEHIAFFEKHGYIEFDGLLSPAECKILSEESERIIRERKHESKGPVATKTVSFFPKTTSDHFDDACHFGRDISKDSSKIQKVLFSPKVTKIAGNLIHKRELRYGFDQVLAGPYAEDVELDTSYFYKSDSVVFSEASSIRGVIIGIAICLVRKESAETVELAKDGMIDIFAHDVGNVIFFSASRDANVGEIKKLFNKKYMLLFLAENPVQYVYEQKDPHVHDLKQEGYVFGDILLERTHPTLFRRTPL